MAEVLEGSGQGQVVGLRGRGQDVVHPLGSLYRGQGKEAVGCSQCTGSQEDGFTLGGARKEAERDEPRCDEVSSVEDSVEDVT